MEYRCNFCNQDFPDLVDYFHHECKFYDEQYLMQVRNDFSMCPNAFNAFKSSNEEHAGNIHLDEEENKCMLTDISVKAVSQILDFLKYNENQSCKETTNEKYVPEQVFNKTEYCSQVQRFAHEKNLDFNLNQPSTSHWARQISENIAHSSSIPPSVSRGLSSFQSINSESNPCHDKNQQILSAEYNPLDYCDIGANQKCEASDAVVKHAHENKQEFKSSSPLRMSFQNINLNLEKYSKMHPRNSASFVRSNVVYEEPKHEGNEYFLQKNTIDTLEKECRRDAGVKTSMSYSSLTNFSNFNADENSFNQYSNIEENPVTRDTERSYRCGRCKKVFITYNALSKHYCDASKEEQHKCDVCGKEFPSNSKLREHYRTHSDERPYGCEKCGKRFKRIDHLKHHSITHSTEMPHVCEMCGRRFKLKKYLSKHYNSHITEKSHVCVKCDKRFKRNMDLDMRF
ncbi:zinc finger protein [Trichonephila inaurata madagascariensis]|uniref:Zinc finger protein n=1 Tax=Trichonephila inaurata madagascariensis TaxID=2747483 RepID=A0A8X6WLF2_9ARAC|nr:zinc finger protein [Trichonephila inaurata madagascariensis]